MKIAVVGCGSVSKMHFKALSENPNTQIVAVADIKHERADEKASLFGARAYYDFDELLRNEELDAVHICTPHYLHTPMAVKALKKGINVLLEKPCSVSGEEIEILRKAQTESGKAVGICFQNRYNASTRRAKEIIDSEKMGKVKSVRAFVTWSRGKKYYSDDWHGTLDKECGGVLINQAIHTVDLVQYLGGNCESVTAHVSNDHLKDVIEVEDTASVLMELKNGVNAILYATLAYAENSDIFVEVSLQSGKIRIEGKEVTVIDESGSQTFTETEAASAYLGRTYWGTGHSALINDYYDCLISGRNFEIDAFEGGKAAQIVACCYLSSKSGETIKLK